MDVNYDEDIDVILRVIIQKCVQIEIVDRYTSVEALKEEVLEVLKSINMKKQQSSLIII